MSQNMRLIRVSAGTTHCCAGQQTLLASSTQKRIFVSPHPFRRILFRESRRVRSVEMEILYANCAGLDVHKKTVKVCLLRRPSTGQPHKEFRTYLTTTEELLQLGDWLKEQGCTHVAFEATGVYWKPVFNLLESSFEVMVVNAQHIKQVPGRKTVVKDAQWIADLLQHGLLKASFIPEQPQRDLRELLRYRTRLVQERTQEINRVHKVLEDANIKLGDVVSDMMGVSARAMLAALLAGEEKPQVLAQLARRKMRSKIPALQLALQGHVREPHRVLLGLHLQHIDALHAMLQDLQQAVDQLLPPFDQDDVLARLDTIPGVGPTTAQIIVAEIGADMSRFADANHLAS